MSNSDPLIGAPSTSVTAAMRDRRSIRAYTDKPVDAALLRTILEIAQRAPSGGNVQPWMVSMLTGDALTSLIAAVGERLAMGPSGYQPEYQIYPDPTPDPWMSRRYGVAYAMYAAMGIERSDKIARAAAMAANFKGFGAPVMLFVHCPRVMGPPQWADMGIWLQSVMLLCREAGLDTCPQEAWANFGATVRAQLGLGDDQILYTGLAIGHADWNAPVNLFPIDRAPLDEVVSWHGF